LSSELTGSGLVGLKAAGIVSGECAASGADRLQIDAKWATLVGAARRRPDYIQPFSL
jgi:hypothetical protein